MEKMEYYDICQYKNGKQPNFPLTDENMLKNLANGTAKALGQNKPFCAAWGHGIYERIGHDDYRCVSSNFDSSD